MNEHDISEQAYKNGYEKGYEDGVRDAAPKWIPVTERLPDTAERVLVCRTWRGMVYKPAYGYYQDFPNQKGCWYILTEEGYYPQREVTHWMPLPEPPRET